MSSRVFFSYALIFSILLDNIILPFDVGFDFRIQYIIYILLLVLMFVYKQTAISKTVIIVLFLIFMFLAFGGIVNGKPLMMLKQVLLILICTIPFYQILCISNFDLCFLFKVYTNVSVLISFVALIQFLSLSVGFKMGYDFSYLGFDMSRLNPDEFRVQAWLAEPSFLSYFLIPAVFVILASYFNLQGVVRVGRVPGIVILLAFLLTQSLISYVAFIFSLGLLVFSKYSFLRSPIPLTLLIGVGLFFSLIMLKVPGVRVRVTDTFDVLLNGLSKKQIHLSSYHFYSNFEVARQSVFEKPFVGFGLGNYETAYDLYAIRVDYAGDTNATPDGASLLFRLVTEMGLIFTFLVVILIWRYRNSRGCKDALWAINNGIFVMLIMRLVRMPHYTLLGLSFFLILFFLSGTPKKLRL